MGNAITKKKQWNKQELLETLVRVWLHELSEEYIKKLILSMPSRCQAVIKARGGATKY